jgi:hypothetical protein
MTCLVGLGHAQQRSKPLPAGKAFGRAVAQASACVFWNSQRQKLTG